MSSPYDSTALEKELSKTLTGKRYVHSLAVAQTCLLLQKQYKLTCDEKELYQCGLMHDLARDWSAQKLIAYADEHSLALEVEEESTPVLLHAPVGACLLADRGFSEEVCTAVRYHTIGSIHMGIMGLVLYVADYIEPNRMHLSDGDRDALMHEPTLESLCLQIVKAEHIHLHAKGKVVTHSGMELYQWLVQGGRF
ncbi:MAG: bis(5'-nucleosyl)-tetraphosphatase (symmetrical) YqeK [Sphaerochaeta sp.]